MRTNDATYASKLVSQGKAFGFTPYGPLPLTTWIISRISPYESCGTQRNALPTMGEIRGEQRELRPTFTSRETSAMVQLAPKLSSAVDADAQWNCQRTK